MGGRKKPEDKMKKGRDGRRESFEKKGWIKRRESSYSMERRKGKAEEQWKEVRTGQSGKKRRNGRKCRRRRGRKKRPDKKWREGEAGEECNKGKELEEGEEGKEGN